MAVLVPGREPLEREGVLGVDDDPGCITVALVGAEESAHRLKEQPDPSILDDVEHRDALVHRRAQALVLLLRRGHTCQPGALIGAQCAGHRLSCTGDANGHVTGSVGVPEPARRP